MLVNISLQSPKTKGWEVPGPWPPVKGSKTQLISSVVIEEFSRAMPERDSSPSRESTPDPSRPSSTRDDGDTILAPDLSLGVGKGLRFEESGTVEAWLAGGETKSIPNIIRLNRNPSWIHWIQKGESSKFC